jgi:hypothetical protein
MATDLGAKRSRITLVTTARSDTVIADRVIVAGVGLAVAAGVAQVATQVVDFAVFDLRIAALNSDVHTSIFGILSLTAQGATGAAVAARCLCAPRRAGWLVLGALIVVLLAVRASLPDDPLALLVPVAVAAVLFWRLTRDDYPRARAVVRVGLCLLAFSFVVHIVGPRVVDALGYGYGSWAYELKGMFKHSTELAGWMLVSAGILAGGLVESGMASRRARRNRRR